MAGLGLVPALTYPEVMALLVDDAHWPWRDRLWCHLVSDTSLDELHAFAEWLGVPPRAFQGDHYDIPDEMRAIALQEGARAVTSREVVTALYSAGLRLPPAQRVTQMQSNASSAVDRV